MWGSIIGDLAGSVYEYDQAKNGVHPVTVNKVIEDNAFFTDNTIMTVAVADAIVNEDELYIKYYKKYVEEYEKYMPEFKPYFDTIFSPDFVKIIKGEASPDSKSSLALTRISPVGFLFKKPSLVDTQAIWATGITHNTPEALSNARLVALLTHYFKQDFTKGKVKGALKQTEKHPGPDFTKGKVKNALKQTEKHPGLDLDLGKIVYKPFEKFNLTCSETMDNVLYAVFSSNCYEEAVTKVISFGGDTGTNASITGGIAEAAFGVPKELVEKAKIKLPEPFVNVINNAYAKMNKKDEDE